MNPTRQTDPAASDNLRKLTESTAELGELADAMPQLVWIADKDGQVTYYNQQVYNYAGAHKDADGHWRWVGLLHPEDLESTAAAWSKAIKTGETYSMEHRIQMVNGDYRWHLSRAHRRGEKWFGTATDIHEHKTAERALQKAYAQLQALYGSGQIQIGYFQAVRDESGKIEDMEVLDANPKTADVYPGLRPKTLLTDVVPGMKDMEHWQRALKVIETGEPQRFEALFEYGEKHSWYDNYYTRFGDGFIAQSLNIDERKKAEEKIRKAQEATDQQRRLYETVADNTPDLIYVFDLHYRFTYANKALLQMWGKTWDEAIGKGLLENGYEPWHAEMHHREIDRVVATKQPIRGTVSFPHATLGKRIYDYIFSPVLNEKGEVEAIAGTTRDISDISHAESEMRHLKDQLELTFNAVPAGISLFDTSGKILLVNDTLARLSGYGSAREMLSVQNMDNYAQKVFEETAFYDESGQRIGPEDMPANAVLHGKAGGRKVIQAVRRSDGESRWVMATASPLHGEDEKLSMVLSTYTDITDQKAAEAVIRESENQFRTLAEKLEQLVTERTAELLRSNADLQQFAHVASHDLKEPLRKIKTFAGMLEKKVSRETAPDAYLFLDKINSAAARMTEMVDGVLAYSSLNADERPVEKIDLCETIRHIEADVEVAIERRDARIDCEQLPPVEGAPVLIYQLFYNLINNSLKFAKADEQLHITIAHEDSVLDGKPVVRIRVTDNGIGFAQEYAARIFDTFSRLNSKDKYEGTGLGLALCKKIVERHGGQIEAQGTEGEGATFFITLPLKQERGQV